MTCHFKLIRFSLLLLFIPFLIAACNNNGGDEKKTDEKSAADTGNNGPQINPPVAALISGTLDTLYTDSLSFTQLPDAQKVVFAFTFRQHDTLTLHGWSATKDTIFNPDPNIRLIKGHASPLPYGNDMYFGNVVLKKGHVKHIKNKLDQLKAKFVLFAPQIINGNHIAYTIFVSKENPASLVKTFVALPTGVNVNPSPPKNY